MVSKPLGIFYLCVHKFIIKLTKKKIYHLVNEDFVFAKVLDHFGVKFYDYSELTLEDLCASKGLKVSKVLRHFDSLKENDPKSKLKLDNYPIDLIVEYLKHAHYIFVKKNLTYISRLLQDFNSVDESATQCVKDLKLIFPMFVEEFVEHIYEEEDTFFAYVMKMCKAFNGKLSPSEAYLMLEQNSVVAFSQDHDDAENSMMGIRMITQDYSLEGINSVHLIVILKELNQLDHELIHHARRENEILFPKAFKLEQKVRNRFANTSSLN